MSRCPRRRRPKARGDPEHSAHVPSCPEPVEARPERRRRRRRRGGFFFAGEEKERASTGSARTASGFGHRNPALEQGEEAGGGFEVAAAAHQSGGRFRILAPFLGLPLLVERGGGPGGPQWDRALGEGEGDQQRAR